MTTLDREDIWLFQNNGFIVAPGKLPENLLELVDAETDRQVAAQMEPISWAYDIGDPKKRIVNRLSKLLQRDRVYMEAATHPVVLNALEGILGPNIELLTNKHNMEMIKPGNAPPVEWHRGEPRSEPPVVTMVIAFDDATEGGGEIEAGLHREGEEVHRVGKGLEDLLVSILDEAVEGEDRIDESEKRRDR